MGVITPSHALLQVSLAPPIPVASAAHLDEAVLSIITAANRLSLLKESHTSTLPQLPSVGHGIGALLPSPDASGLRRGIISPSPRPFFRSPSEAFSAAVQPPALQPKANQRLPWVSLTVPQTM